MCSSDLASFAVILVTVLVQGSTLAPLARALRLGGFASLRPATLTEAAARARVVQAQLAEVEQRSKTEDGGNRHPWLVEEYSRRARAAARFSQAEGALDAARAAHFEVILAAIAAGRVELLRLHRIGQIHDTVLNAIERELDLEEVRTRPLAAGDEA